LAGQFLEGELKKNTIGIIGAGNMGEAIIRGISKKGAGIVFACDADSAKIRRVTRLYKVKKIILDELAKQCNIIIICVKPQDIDSVLKALRGRLRQQQLVISIAAGITTRYLEQFLGGECAVVRGMPNMPGLIGKGITAYCRGRYARKEAGRFARIIFSAMGDTIEVSEAKMNAVTSVSGSGPGFIAYLTEMLVQAACKSGLDYASARLLCLRTLAGTASLLAESALDPAELVRRVASKGGTTEAGLAVLKKKNIGGILAEMVNAAAQRAKELSK
jgi:pyrroline-5-carboxylate reductase